MPEQPKGCFIGHELHRWSNFDLLIVDSALSDQNRTENFVNVGKVTLTGVVRSVKGALPIALRAKAEGKIGLLAPKDNAPEAAVVRPLLAVQCLVASRPFLRPVAAMVARRSRRPPRSCCGMGRRPANRSRPCCPSRR